MDCSQSRLSDSGSGIFYSDYKIRIPWNTLSNGNGRPASFNWFGYKVFTNGDGENPSDSQADIKDYKTAYYIGTQ
jgi:hypothetical protein